jgi:hypothetical protein
VQSGQKIITQEGKLADNHIPTSSDGITLRNINDQQYIGDIKFGNPPQLMTVMFDTGSSIIYTLTSKCQKGCPERLARFQVEQSQSFEDITAKRQDQNYGQGFVSGDVAKDVICFSTSTTDCPVFEFLAVDKASDLQKDQFSGIIGLAPPSSEEKSVVLPTVNQMTGIFAFYLSKGAGSTGNLKFGGYDLQKYAKPGSTDGDIVWNQVIDDGWTIALSGVKYNKGSYLEIKAEQLTLDTGLSYALVPPRDIESIIDVIKTGSNFTCQKAGYNDLDLFECNCTEKDYQRINSLQLQINNKEFTLPREAWMKFDKNEERHCKILMHPYDISMTATYKWVIGVQFLQNFYSIFDIQNKRIGLIEARDA